MTASILGNFQTDAGSYSENRTNRLAITNCSVDDSIEIVSSGAQTGRVIGHANLTNSVLDKSADTDFTGTTPVVTL